MAPGLLSKMALIDEKEYAYPQTALQAFTRRFDSHCELVHKKHEGNCCNRGRPFGERQSARPKQRSLPPGAGLLVKIDNSEPNGVREFSQGADPPSFWAVFAIERLTLVCFWERRAMTCGCRPLICCAIELTKRFSPEPLAFMLPQ